MPDTDDSTDVEAMADDARGDDTFRPHSIDWPPEYPCEPGVDCHPRSRCEPRL